MRVQIFLALLLVIFPLAACQTPFTFFGGVAMQGLHRFMDSFQSVMRIFRQPARRPRNLATEAPVEESLNGDELFPRDCGRNNVTNTGNLCFPVGSLCRDRASKGGDGAVHRFGRHLYYFSWLDTDTRVSNTKWSWFNARNYCRKRCMDLVSFETKNEYRWVKSFINGNVPYFWTSGRLCDFDGCDAPRFLPKNINGWFWSANQVKMPATNSARRFHDWSPVGGFEPPKAQPDNREETQQGGDTEACLAVLNNFYGDGIKWHDVACHHEKPIICEDVEGHLNFARQTFPNMRIP